MVKKRKRSYMAPRPNSPAMRALKKLRGGFGSVKGLVGSGKDLAKSYINSTIDRAANRLNRQMPGLSPMTRSLALGAKKKIGDTIDSGVSYVEKILEVHPEDMSIVRKDGEPTQDIAFGSRKVSIDYQGPVKSRTFVENFAMGEKTSKSLMNAAKMNGTKTICLFDSLNDANFKDPTKAHREYLEIVTGFNQKIIYNNERLTGKWSDIFENIYKIGFNTSASTNPDNQIRTVDYRIYAGAMNFVNKLRFRNNMNTTSAKLKVHIIAARQLVNGSLTFSSPNSCVGYLPTAANDTVKGMDSNKIIKATETYPRPYYTSGTPAVWTYNVTDSMAHYTHLVPSAKLTDSEFFNTRFKIIKTFKKTLDVGDELVLNLTSTFGSGLRLDKVLALNTELGTTEYANWTFPYYILVELNGPTVTAETTTAANFQDKFLGTAPCSVSFESKQYFTYALESNSGVPTGSLSGLTETDFANRIGQPLVRYFVKDEVVTSTPYNVKYSDTRSGGTLAVKTVSDSNIATQETIT